MLLMIDNYDSFTYNLVQYLGELGADVCVHRNDQITVAEIEQLKPDHIVISPGPCTPTEAGVSVGTIQKLAGRIPLWACAWATRVSASLRRQDRAREAIDAWQDFDDSP